MLELGTNSKLQEMEQERLAREKEEKERLKRVERLKNQFDEPHSQWEKDKSELQSLASKDKETTKDAASPAAAEVKKAVVAADDDAPPAKIFS